MRRSVCLVEPSTILAGEVGTWKVTFQTAQSLVKGARIKFDLMSCGRVIDWETPNANLRAARNVIYGQMPEGKIVEAKEVNADDAFVPHFEFVLPAPVKVGEVFTVVLGAPPQKKGEAAKIGNRAQTTVQRRRPFRLFIDPKGKGAYESPEAFSVDIKGNALETIRVLVPSVVTRNKRFDAVIRFEDAFGNLTGNADEETLIDLSYENFRGNLSWKLFVPETGFVTLPNIYLNEIGVYRIQLTNQKTKERFFSSPIKCFSFIDHEIYWGLLRGESERVDSTVNIETCLRHFRDEQSLDFFASSPFENSEETPNEVWKLISQNVMTFNEDDRFTALLGFQWYGGEKEEGIRQLIHQKDSKPILRYKEQKYNLLKKVYAAVTAKDVISVPCFTMAKGLGSDFSDFNPEFEPVVEIYSAWGSSECLAKEGNPRPIHGKGKGGIHEWGPGSVRHALNAGHRFGFVAGGLDDRGAYSELFEADQTQYSPGLTAILSEKHTRDALCEALRSRCCYATTGERIVLGFSLAGHQMGSELSIRDKPGLAVNRHLAGYVAGTAPIDRVEVIRNGGVMHTMKGEGTSLDFTYDDMEKVNAIALNPNKTSPFIYYYLRIFQQDNAIAWSSPIWVDCSEPAKPLKKDK